MPNHSPHQAASLDRAFLALADPTRRAMVERLSQGAASVSDLAAPFAMSLPAILQHLAVLEGAGLVASVKKGRVRVCAVQPQALAPVTDWIAARRREWSERLDRLAAYLDETNKDAAP